MEDILDEAVIDPEKASRAKVKRALQPRFGAFVTITASLLFLFGAASRVGKNPTHADDLFGVDRLAEQRMSREEDRQRAQQTIGTVSVTLPNEKPPSLALDDDYLTPQRDMTPPRQIYADEEIVGSIDNRTNDPVLAAGTTNANSRERRSSYTVQTGDTWFKITRSVLGDGNRWQEVMNANPGARDGGLRVGMTLNIPGDETRTASRR